MKETLEALSAKIATLSENIEKLNSIDLSPLSERDNDECAEHLRYVAGICQAYIDYANGFNPDETE